MKMTPPRHPVEEVDSVLPAGPGAPSTRAAPSYSPPLRAAALARPHDQAQQDSRLTSRVKVCAASRRLSAMVRYGAQVSARSLTVSPNLIA